jgi:hypothetical protein
MPNSANLLLFFLFVILLNVACNKEKQTRQPISLTVNKRITQFNDTTFFTSADAMVYGDSSLYIASDKTHKIYQLGSSMNLIGSMGRKGKGPGEFTEITDMCFANDSLYVYDRAQAKIVVYGRNNRLTREIGVHEAYCFSLTVDRQSHIFLSTPERDHPITELNARGQKIRSFGQNIVGKTSRHFLRNQFMLFIYKNKLVAVSLSEPMAKVYSLDGKPIHKAKIIPPEIQKFIQRVKKENTEPLKHPHFVSVGQIFFSASMYKNNLYLLGAMQTIKNTKIWPHKFTFVFKYKLKPNGNLIFKKAFKLFRHNHHKLLYGFRLAAMKKHKLLVYDLQSGALVEFKDKHL